MINVHSVGIEKVNKVLVLVNFIFVVTILFISIFLRWHELDETFL